ncbi:hypothetical protein TNCV_4647611 [Trichonephila clavipes]|uniref:Uncharacterized protein n=1 Tax=Trichonephila clavipes TaxID=2585209 RepID=A0A8X6ST99_TRICX|nr:hypothetical protein TNCV_4647611 [Trichonephila clavipes]
MVSLAKEQGVQGIKCNREFQTCCTPKVDDDDEENINVIQFSFSRAFGDEPGCGSPAIKVSDHDKYVMSSSPVPLKTHRNEDLWTICQLATCDNRRPRIGLSSTAHKNFSKRRVQGRILLITVEPQVISLGWWKEKRRGRPLTTFSVSSHKTVVEPNQNVLSPAWCSKLRLTTAVHSALCRDEFCKPRSDIVRQVALATTTTGSPLNSKLILNLNLLLYL